MFCIHCGKPNDDAAKFCAACGKPLAQSAKSNPTPESSGNQPITQEDLYKAAIGPHHQDYYLQRFQRFDNSGKGGVSWNWPSFFATFYWFLYRKMWPNALLYLFLPWFVVVVIAVFARPIAGTLSAVLYPTYFVVILIVLPMYANSLYYRHCKKKIADAKVSFKDPQKQFTMLMASGGTNILVAVLRVLIFICILASIAIPSYTDYVVRSKVTEGLNLAEPVKTAVAETYQDLGHIPAGNNLAGPNSYGLPVAASISGAYVTAVGVLPGDQDGTVVIGIKYGDNLGGGIPGGDLLVFTGAPVANGFQWVCGYDTEVINGMSLTGKGTNIPAKYLPASCR